MGYAFIAGTKAVNSTSGGGATSETTPGINTTGATLLLIIAHHYSGATDVAVSDSKGNSGWTALTESHATNPQTQIWYCLNPTSVGSGHTFTLGGGTNVYSCLEVLSFSGSKATLAFDQQNGAQSSSATSLATGSVTPTEDNELIIAALSWDVGNTVSIDSGFTGLNQTDFGSGNNMGGASAYKIQTSAAAVNPTWTIPNASGAAARIATFKSSAAVGSSYNFSGPSGGVSGSASTNFTLTPNAALGGADTVNLSDGGAGGTFTPSSLSFANGATAGQTFTYTPASAGAKVLTPTSSTLGLTFNPTTLTYTATAAPLTILVTNANLYFSPFNWFSDGAGALAANNVRGSSSYARCSNPGGYLKFKVTTPASGVVKLNLDTTMLQDLTAANCPRLAISVDGKAFTNALLAYSASAVQVTLASGLTAATHTFIVFFQGVVLNGSSAMGDRWNDSATGSSVVKITGLEIDGTASMSAQTLRTKTLLVYGDSITEGADTAGAANGAGDQDSTLTYAMYLAESRDAEVGIIGWSGAGWLAAGYGNVPALYNATDASQHWNKYFAGQSRLVTGLFSPAPDFILVNHGKNDTASVTAGATALLAALRVAAPLAKIWVTPAFDGTHAADALAATLPSGSSAFLNLGTDTRLVSGSSAGLFAADSVPHPNSRGHADFAARLAVLAEAQVNGSTLVPSITVDGSNHPVLNWSAVTAAAGYDVFRRATLHGAATLVATVTAPTVTYTDTAGTPGSFYFIVAF